MNTSTMTSTITTAEAAQMIENSNGKVFSVTFIKRTTGEVRTMRAMLGENTRKDLAGGPAAYNPADHGLIWVYLMAGDCNRAESRNRRSIAVEGIQRLALDGKTFEVA